MALMGAVLAALVYLAFFLPTPSGAVDPSAIPDLPPPRVEVPELDATLLATARDGTREERLRLEAEPLQHLLAKSLDVGPTVAQALGMPSRPVPVPTIRADAARHRGAWLWYKGRLEELAGPKPGHPVPGYSVYEASLRTAEGDPVLATFSMKPGVEVVPGSWVRVEGFFLKLRDLTFPATVDQAPLLVGREIQHAYEDWPAVTELDQAAFNGMRDGGMVANEFHPDRDSERDIEHDQAEALWHLAAYARDQKQLVDKADWRARPAFSDRKQWDAVMRGTVQRGTPMRLLGTLAMTRTTRANTNPAGIEYWTEAWIMNRDLGGRLVPVWIPGNVERMPSGTGLEVRCFYYKRMVYETRQGRELPTPVFVAAGLDRYVMESQPGVRDLGIAVLVLVSLTMLGIWRMSKREQRRWLQHQDDRNARRRKERGRTTAPATPTSS